jgi:uncharacterized membrane protein YkoI
MKWNMLVFIFLLSLGAPIHQAHSADKGITMEEAEKLVLEQEPGEVTGHDVDHRITGKVYGFDITKEDGTVINIETDENGTQLSRKIKSLGEGVELPPPTIDKATASQNALDHINETKFGVKGRVIGGEYKLYNGTPAYEIIVKKSMKDTYRVYVDPEEGKILGSEYVK